MKMFIICIACIAIGYTFRFLQEMKQEVTQ